MASDAEKRFTDLEIRQTHQSRLLDELSTVLFEQQRAIDLLHGRVRELEERLLGETSTAEKPPHY